MAAHCIDCAEKLTLGRRLLGHERCPECERNYETEQQRQRERQETEYTAAVAEYDEVIDQLRLANDLEVVLPRIRRAAEVTPLAQSEVQKLHAAALSEFVDELLADDVLTQQEDLVLGAVSEALNVRLTPEDTRRYIVGACNAAVMPRDPNPQIILNRAEIPYWRCGAGVLAERVVKEYRTNFQSVSIPIGKTGMRYRAGQARGRQVVVGTTIEVADQGWLTVTSQRIVFSGAKQVLEFPLHRMVGINLFGDGLGLQVANRKTVPTFRTGVGVNEVTAAVINAAAALDRGTFVPPLGDSVQTSPPPPVPKLLVEHGYSDDARPSAPPSISVPANLGPARQPAAEERVTPAVRDIFRQLDKFPGQREYIDQIKALYGLGGGSRSQLEELLQQSHEAAVQVGFPPSLTPYPLNHPQPPQRPIVREVPSGLEPVFQRLQELGLTPEQASDLREDYRREEVSDLVLQGISAALLEWARESDDEGAEAALAKTPASGAPDEAAALVYQRAGEGSRTRELFDVLASRDAALTPEEIGRLMRPQPDGSPVSKASVRAAIRNARRVEKGLRAEGKIDRDVLVVDWSAYARDGANRYSLRPEDRAVILRID